MQNRLRCQCWPARVAMSLATFALKFCFERFDMNRSELA
jgi:hypothetical protein